MTSKLGGQIDGWRGLGADARLFLLSPSSREHSEARLDAEVHTFDSPWRRVAALGELVRAVRRFSPDVVYVRSDRFVPPLSGRRFPAPMVVELNTLAAAELANRAAPVRIYNRLCNTVLLRSASGIVGVSREIVDNARRSNGAIPAVTIPNGVDPLTIPSLDAPSNPHPRLCFLGSPRMRWHGLDKLVALASARPDWTIDVIGVAPDQFGMTLPANVIAHGRLERDAYLGVMAHADAALGTLALHRKGMSEASPLKVPAYLLAGIPTIIAYDDSNFLDVDPWYLLRLPNTETNVMDSLSLIDAWVRSVRGKRAPRAEVEARTGSLPKEVARLAFLKEVADRAERS